MAEIQLRNGETLNILESTSNINMQKKQNAATFKIHVIKTVEFREIKRTDILTMKDN